MGTRCATIVSQETRHGGGSENVELFRFYRHWDGYPYAGGHGFDLAEAVIEANEKENTNRNWVQDVFGVLFNMDARMEVEPRGVEHGDLDYLYEIHGTYDAFGGKHGVPRNDVTITVWEFNWDEGYDDAMRRKPLFSGTPEAYIDYFEDAGF